MIIVSFNRIDRLIEKDLLDPIAKSMLYQFKSRFKSPTILYKKGLFKKVKYQPNLISTAIDKDKLLNDLIFRADNLTYYIGHAFIGLNPLIMSRHNVTMHGEIDSAGFYKGRIEGSSTDELYEFISYIAKARGKAFDQVNFRYGQQSPPTFTCYIDFDTNELKPKKGFFDKLFG